MNPIRLCALFVLTSVSLAHGQWWQGFIEDGPHVGLADGGDTVDPGVAWGWQVEANLSELFTVELAYTHFEDDITEERFAEIGAEGARGRLDINTVALTGRLNLIENKQARVYGGVGIGWYPINEKISRTVNSGLADIEVDIDQEFGYHVAGGVELFINESWEVLFDARYTFLESDMDVTRARDTGRFLETETEDTVFSYDHVLLRVGINYRF